MKTGLTNIFVILVAIGIIEEASMYTPTPTTTITTRYTTSTPSRRTARYRSTSTSWGGGGASAASLSGYMFAMTVIGAFVEQYLQI